MSSALNYPEKSNPFFDDDEDDDEFSFGRLSSSSGPTRKPQSGFSNVSAPSKSKGFGGAYGGGVSSGISDDDFARPVRYDNQSKFESIQTEIDNSKNRQIDSTQRALSSIYESERMGVATAEVMN